MHSQSRYGSYSFLNIVTSENPTWIFVLALYRPEVFSLVHWVPYTTYTSGQSWPSTLRAACGIFGNTNRLSIQWFSWRFYWDSRCLKAPSGLKPCFFTVPAITVIAGPSYIGEKEPFISNCLDVSGPSSQICCVTGLLHLQNTYYTFFFFFLATIFHSMGVTKSKTTKSNWF